MGVRGCEGVYGGLGRRRRKPLRGVSVWSLCARGDARLGWTQRRPWGVYPAERSQHRAAVLLSFSRSAHTGRALMGVGTQG